LIIDVEDNPNCDGVGVMRFQDLSLPKPITRLNYLRETEGILPCRVTGWGPDGPEPARVRKVADSGDGSAWLIYGGPWGVRLMPSDHEGPWDMEDDAQWGEPFVTVDQLPGAQS